MIFELPSSVKVHLQEYIDLIFQVEKLYIMYTQTSTTIDVIGKNNNYD